MHSTRLRTAAHILAVWALSLPLCSGVVAQEAQQKPSEPPEPAFAELHVAAAKLLAGEEFAAVAEGYLCRSPGQAGAFLGPYIAPLIDGSDRLVTGQAFSNLYYVGLKFVGAWVLTTDDGLIVFDALFNEEQARDVLAAGIKQLGLEPADIRHVIITHGHADHYGGARYFQREFGATVWLSQIDWDYMEAHRDDDPPAVFTSLWPKELPLRDGVAEDGAVLELGEATVRFVLTPGHTPGTLSAVVRVDDGGVFRHLTLWGGTAMPPDSAGIRQMHASLLKLWEAGERVNAEGVISTHAFVEDSFGRLERRQESPVNPFNLGHDGFNRIMAIHSECILAQAARFAAWGR